ncbi:MAG: manganese-dependent inorganic pyrophosphatase [Clostridium sp. 28_12]|jgi:inorganic diphosphatase ppaC|nr:MAG: manganese-dependent inorganic pyrophosphatase [Clostridium sp. 28_12]
MEEVIVFGHKSPDTDTICSAIVMADLQTKIRGKKVTPCRLGEINEETKFALKKFNAEAPKFIEKVEEGQKVILVDHNEFSQSVEGIENAKIEAVVDHHRINNFETSEPLFYYAQPVGCTSTILFELYSSNNIEIPAQMAGLMLSAIISDTLLLKSPTTTEKDKKALEALAKIADVDVNIYGLEMLKAGTNLDKYTEDELIRLDAKKIEKEDIKYVIAQVNTVSIPDILKRKEKIEQEINKEILAKGLSLFVFVITDIINSNSEAIVLGDRTDVIAKSYEIKDNIAVMPGVVSRKKQVLPLVEKNM